MSDPANEPVDRPTAAPFLGALLLAVVVITGIFVFNRFSGESDGELISRAVMAQNDALQRADYRLYVDYTCQALYGTEQEILDRQRNSVANRGERYVDGVGNLEVDGDSATATVTYHFDNDPDDKVGADMKFVREAGAWKVCSPGPA